MYLCAKKLQVMWPVKNTRYMQSIFILEVSCHCCMFRMYMIKSTFMRSHTHNTAQYEPHPSISSIFGMVRLLRMLGCSFCRVVLFCRSSFACSFCLP